MSGMYFKESPLRNWIRVKPFALQLSRIVKYIYFYKTFLKENENVKTY